MSNFFQQVKEHTDPHTFIPKYLPGGKFGGSGRYYTCCDPVTGENNPSLTVYLPDGNFVNHATNSSGGDWIALHAYIHHCEQLASANALNNDLSLGISANRAPTKASNFHKAPRASDRAVSVNQSGKDFSGHKTLNKQFRIDGQKLRPSEIYIYRDASGLEVLGVCRFTPKAGGKTIRPYHNISGPGEAPRWIMGLGTKNKGLPLYNLPELVSTDKIMVHEGEKCANFGARYLPEYCHTTSQGGCGGAKKTDWSPLKDKDVYIFPDNDEPGFKYAAQVIELAIKAGCKSVSMVKIPDGAPKGGDIADLDPSQLPGLAFVTIDLQAEIRKSEHASKDEIDDSVVEELFCYERNGKMRLNTNSEIVADGMVELGLLDDFRFDVRGSGSWYVFNPETCLWIKENTQAAFSAIFRGLSKVLKPLGRKMRYDISVKERVFKELHGRCEQLDWDVIPKKTIPFRNGLYNIETKKMTPLTREMYLHSYRNVEYYPGSKDTFTVDWLKTLFGTEQCLSAFKTVLRTVLLGGRLTKLVELVGPGATGKSTAVDLVRTLAGNENCATLNLNEIGGRFGASALRHKKVCIIPDAASFLTAKSAENLRPAVTGDEQSGEEKYKNSSSFRFLGVVIIVCNQAITIQGENSGDVRRRFMINFTGKRVPFEKQDKDFILKLTARDAISCLITELLEMTDADTTAALNRELTTEQLQETSNPIALWEDSPDVTLRVCATEHLLFGTGKKGIDGEYLNWDTQAYPSYKKFCSDNGYTPLGKQTFQKRLELYLIEHRRLPGIEKRRYNGVYGLQGVTLDQTKGVPIKGKDAPIDDFKGFTELERAALQYCVESSIDADNYYLHDYADIPALVPGFMGLVYKGIAKPVETSLIIDVDAYSKFARLLKESKTAKTDAGDDIKEPVPLIAEPETSSPMGEIEPVSEEQPLETPEYREVSVATNGLNIALQKLFDDACNLDPGNETKFRQIQKRLNNGEKVNKSDYSLSVLNCLSQFGAVKIDGETVKLIE